LKDEDRGEQRGYVSALEPAPLVPAQAGMAASLMKYVVASAGTR
jgi:hypothetical protein